MVVFTTGGFRIILELWIEQDRYYNMIVFTKMIPVNQSRWDSLAMSQVIEITQNIIFMLRGGLQAFQSNITVSIL